ncbi:MAG: hypothetical protein GY906_11385 [bacterium]|nr:hypothetical protein [bacterium]
MPADFPDHRHELFGRARDIDFLLQRTKHSGLTIITGRPRLGKTWLLVEVSRRLSTDLGYLVGYHECRAQSPDLLLRTVSDLYTRWLADSSYWDQARRLWSAHGEDLTTHVGKAVGQLFKPVSKMNAPEPLAIGDLVAGVFNGLATAQQDLLSGGLQLKPLDYDQAHELVQIIARISSQPIVLVLDAWEKSPSVEFEYQVLDRLLKHLGQWPLCHIFAAIRKPEHTGTHKTDLAAELGHDLVASSPAARPSLELLPMNFEDADERQRMIAHVRDEIPGARETSDQNVEAMAGGFPGVLEHWRDAANRQEAGSEHALRQLAEDAQQYRYREFDRLFPSLTTDQRILAIRLAILPRLDELSWRILKDIIVGDIDHSQHKLDELQLKGVLDTPTHPTYGHDTRHASARHWFLARHNYRSMVARHAESLAYLLAARHPQVEDSNRPIADALVSLVPILEELEVGDDAKALSNGMLLLFGDVEGKSPQFAFESGWRAAVGRSPTVVPFVSLILIHHAYAKGQAGDTYGEIADYNAAIDMPETPPMHKARALFNRGVTKGRTGDTDGEIADYSATIEMPDAPPEQKAKAHLNRGIAMARAGNTNGAIVDFNAIIKWSDAPPVHKAKALLNRGNAKGLAGNTDGEIADYSAIIEMPDAPPEQKAKAHLYRGIMKDQADDTDGAIADYNAIIDMPDAPPEQKSQALIYRGSAKDLAGNTDGEIADFNAVIDMPDAPPEQKAQALIYRGIMKDQADDTDSAIADFNAVIDMPDAPPEPKAQALLKRGSTKIQADDTDGAIADFNAALDMPGSPSEKKAQALIYRGITKGLANDTEGAIADFNAVLDMPDASSQLKELAKDVRRIPENQAQETGD